MILTQCACCAAPLPHLAKQCSRCKTRYCGPACQAQHWKDGGHDKRCKKIRKGGGAELYNADQKYKEAVAVAVEKCTEDTKGQTCYICTEAVHRRTKEGLVRGCACHTTEGFVHVSCLAEQAKILFAEWQENTYLDRKARSARWRRWGICGLCEQEYHGVVSCALGWACWKTYVGRPEGDWAQLSATTLLGNGLYDSDRSGEALSVREAKCATLRRVGVSERAMLGPQGNLASSYEGQGMHEAAARLQQDVYAGYLRIHGEEYKDTLAVASNYASFLKRRNRFEEAQSVLRKMMPVARRVLGERDETTLKMKRIYAEALYLDERATIGDLREAIDTLAETEGTARCVLGSAHPLTLSIADCLRESRAELGACEQQGEGESCFYQDPRFY